ncbi:MAG: glycosyltransferase [Pseudomonadota bacterium]
MTGEVSGSSPDVTVIIAGYKAEAFIGTAIASALTQAGPSVEVIVVDDCSPDDTAGAAKAAFPDDPRLRVERLASNTGPSGARNHGLSLAHGRYYAVLDADDTFADGRLDRLVGIADAGGHDLVADNMDKVPVPHHPEAAGPFLKPGAIGDGVNIGLTAYIDPLSDTHFGAPLGYLKPLFRMATLNRLGARYDETLRNSEDFYLVANLLAQGARFHLAPDADYNYTVQVGSESHRLGAERAQAILDADEAFVAIHGADFDNACMAASKRRQKWIRKMRLIERVAEGLKSGRPVSAAMAVGRDPGAAPALVNWSVEVIRNRTR